MLTGVCLTAARAGPWMASRVRQEQLCLGVLKAPLFLCSPSLPALDWQLPSHSGPYELRIEVQPKSHHRAHYETEGSRGAVKASAGGHPVVQVWLLIRPTNSSCLGTSQPKTVLESQLGASLRL